MKHTAWSKIAVFKRCNNDRRMTLSLKKEKFIENMERKVNDPEKGMSLISIVMFNPRNEHWIEHRCPF